jgi:hypothetical protein
LDIGSRIDGFVAQVASFRSIEVLDIRPNPYEIPNIFFKQVDLMSDSNLFENYCDSISCLPTLEHFGLGRYGDPIDPDGWKIGIKNISKILKVSGIIYLSVPIGKDYIYFNAHRVFDLDKLLKELNTNNLTLDSVYYIEAGLPGVKGGTLNSIRKKLESCEYLLGIFICKKI